jgi:hypothetical protein
MHRCCRSGNCEGVGCIQAIAPVERRCVNCVRFTRDFTAQPFNKLRAPHPPVASARSGRREPVPSGREAEAPILGTRRRRRPRTSRCCSCGGCRQEAPRADLGGTRKDRRPFPAEVVTARRAHPLGAGVCPAVSHLEACLLERRVLLLDQQLQRAIRLAGHLTWDHQQRG